MSAPSLNLRQVPRPRALAHLPAPRASPTRFSVGEPSRALLRVCRWPSPQASQVLARYEHHSSDSHSANRHEAEQCLLDRDPEDVAEDDHAPIRSSGVSSAPAASRRSPLLVWAWMSSIAGFAAAKAFTQRSTRLASMTFLAIELLTSVLASALSASQVEHMTAAKVHLALPGEPKPATGREGSDTTPDCALGVSDSLICIANRRASNREQCRLSQ